MSSNDPGETTSKRGANPVLVEVHRGNGLESRHRGAAAIADSRGHIVAAWGDIDHPIFPRSAVKMIQALPLIECGAADRFRLTGRQLALACASHSGEPAHVHAVEGWLAQIGLNGDALECGTHDPFDERTAQELIAAGRQPSTLHNNCSGKHAGFLTAASHLNFSLAAYIDGSHPIQRLVTTVLSEMSELDLGQTRVGVDGCGIPVHALPLRNLASAMAKFASPEKLGGRRGEAARRLAAAMTGHPWLVGGSGRFDTRAMAAGGSRFVVKMGAEGVHVAIVPDLGLGIALKIDDGARRAAELAMATLLQSLRLLDREAAGTLVADAVINSRGEPVGTIRPSDEWRLLQRQLYSSADRDIKHER
jgi:L-asparaginase II